ncbi:PKD domain-containing protein [Pontibacter sp. G13]|uniref:DUF7948 domain-containing protein n=1 Tax=Pontibacter sp. G13 TaxID=3074898 RepID=UPI002889B823|nr:PKD domain-containing protein [Pontibacter sp. G13]WNJ18573.1 PKD domain-containing protein [Pontibacter sp. G13]
MIRSILFSLLLGSLLAGGWWLLQADQTYMASPVEPGNSHLRFIENQGQWEAHIQYLARLNQGAVFFEDNRITFHLTEDPLLDRHNHDHSQGFGHVHTHELPEPDSSIMQMHHAFQISFPGSNPQPQITTDLKDDTYFNYFVGNNPAKWASKVPLYEVIQYQELYPGIDMRWFGAGNEMKYEFWLDQGVSPAVIEVQYSGLNDLRLEQGQLILETALGELKELAPLAWQISARGNIPVACEFRLKRGKIHFHFPDGIDPNLPLVIDPTMVFSTYTGSTSDNWGFTATYDPAGNAYAGGIQYGSGTGYPLSLGAFQTVYVGGTSEVTISKFNANGTQLLYSTYLGGDPGFPTGQLDDIPHSLIVDENGQLVVFGRTLCPDFPTTPGVISESHQGGYDIFVSIFSSDGTSLIASTFIGGSGDDGQNGNLSVTGGDVTQYNYGDDSRGEVILSPNGEIIVGSVTQSSDFPIGTGGYQTTYSGIQDGLVMGLSPDLTAITFATFLGGIATDAIYSLKLDEDGNIYTAGGTNSANFPASGGYQSSFQGGLTDGFIAKFDPFGSSLMASTYLGTSSYDQAYLLDLDNAGNVYVMGQTLGAFPVVSPAVGPIQSTPGGRQFITKLDGDLTSIIYSTRYGSSVPTPDINISPTALLVDNCENVYAMGWGGTVNQNYGNGNTNNMPVTSDALQSTTDGSDFHMIVFDRDIQNLVYASYFGGSVTGPIGGDHVDGGTSRFDKEGIVYHAVCAGCGGNSSFPTLPGNVVSTTNNSGNCNLAIFKMNFELNNVIAQFTPRDTSEDPINLFSSGCAPLEVNFDNQSYEGFNPGAVTYFWEFDDQGASSNLENPVHTYQDSGLYRVMLVITDSASCNISDTTYRLIMVFPPPVVEIDPFDPPCLGDTLRLRSNDIGSDYLWEGPNILANETTRTVSVLGVPGDEYVLTFTDSRGCSNKDSIITDALQPPTSNPGGPYEMCLGDTIQLSGSGGVEYQWNSGSQILFAETDTPTVSPQADAWFSLTVIDSAGCRDRDSVMVSVNPLPEVDAGEDKTICVGESTQLGASGAVNYVWSPALEVDNPFIPNPTADPPTDAEFIVLGTDANGCQNQDTMQVSVIEPPLASVEGANSGCQGARILLTASGGETYQWGHGPTDAEIYVIVDSVPKVYTVVATLGECVGIPATIVVNPDSGFPNADFMFTPEVGWMPQEVQFINQSTGAATYFWDFQFAVNDNDRFSDEENPAVVFPFAGEYEITLVATSIYGCSDTITKDLLIENITLTVPSAFTPNEDEYNPYFYPGHYGLERLDITIYDRWGEKIYESLGPLDARWDGTYLGSPVQEGVYVYVVVGTGFTGQQIERIGTVTLIR